MLKTVQRRGTNISLYREIQRVGVVQPGKEKDPSLEQFSRIQRGPKRNLEREFLQAYEVIGQVEWL